MIDHSYGVIPIRYLGEKPQVLLIKNKGGHWSFPKGHPEGNESGTETARRELREETGVIDCDIQETPVFVSKLQIEKNGKTIDREITFYLGKVAGNNVEIDPNEVHEFSWLLFDDAFEQITYPQTKQILSDVIEYLKQHK